MCSLNVFTNNYICRSVFLYNKQKEIKIKSMSDRRNLKKIINNSFEYLYEDCLLYSVANDKTDLNKTENLMKEIAKSHQDLLSRLSVSEGKELKNRTKAYYRKINEDLNNQINTFGIKIQALD